MPDDQFIESYEACQAEALALLPEEEDTPTGEKCIFPLRANDVVTLGHVQLIVTHISTFITTHTHTHTQFTPTQGVSCSACSLLDQGVEAHPQPGGCATV